MEHEIIDLLDENGQKKGVIDKAVAHKEGQWHRSVHVWVLNDKGEVLLQHRCKEKTFFANCWDCAFAGHIGAGEQSLESAIREGEEELGLKLNKDDFEFLFTFKDHLVWKDKISNEFVDVYLVRGNYQIDSLNLQKEEVDDVKWMKFEDFYQLVINNSKDILLHNKEEYDRLKHIFVQK